MLAREPADAAAERVADDADVRRRAVQRGETVLGGRHDHVLPQRAGLDPGAPVVGVDLDPRISRMFSRSVPSSGPCDGGAVPGALDDDLQVALGGVVDGRDDLLDRGRQRDDGGPQVGGEVPGLPGVVPAGVVGEDVLVLFSWRSWRAPRDGLLKCPER